MNRLCAVTAVIEVGAGLTLFCLPSAAANLLLGTPLEVPAALIVARVGGAALLTIGIACWLTRNDAQSPVAKGLVTAMVIYNLGVAFILGVAGMQSQSVGIALWPAVALHASMTVWCVMSLLSWKTETELGGP